jgi:hypothetical protein
MDLNRSVSLNLTIRAVTRRNIEAQFFVYCCVIIPVVVRSLSEHTITTMPAFTKYA